MQEFAFKYGKFSVSHISNQPHPPVFTITMDFPDALFMAQTAENGKTDMKFMFRSNFRVKYFQQDEYIKRFEDRDVYYPLIVDNLDKVIDVDDIDFHVRRIYIEQMRRNNSLYTGSSFEVVFNLDSSYVTTNDIINIKKAFSKAFKSHLDNVPQYDVKAHEEEKREYIQNQQNQFVVLNSGTYYHDDLPF